MNETCPLTSILICQCLGQQLCSVKKNKIHKLNPFVLIGNNRICALLLDQTATLKCCCLYFVTFVFQYEHTTYSVRIFTRFELVCSLDLELFGSLGHLKRKETLLMVLVPDVLCLLWWVKMSAVKNTFEMHKWNGGAHSCKPLKLIVNGGDMVLVYLAVGFSSCFDWCP